MLAPFQPAQFYNPGTATGVYNLYFGESIVYETWIFRPINWYICELHKYKGLYDYIYTL